MTQFIARMVFPFALAVSAAFLVKGYAEVGDGFSAGVVAALGAVAQFIALDHKHAARVVGATWAWPVSTIGLVLALSVALGPIFAGLPPVTHFPQPGESVYKFGSLEFHTAVLFDIGILLLVYGALVGTFDRLFPLLKGDEQ